MCTHAVGTFFHLLWKCSKIQAFWIQVVRFLHNTMGSPITCQPKPCLLGIFLDPEFNKFTKLILNETLFSAQKVIARVWMRPNPPEISHWIAEERKSMLFYPIRNVYTPIEGVPPNTTRSGTGGSRPLKPVFHWTGTF